MKGFLWIISLAIVFECCNVKKDPISRLNIESLKFETNGCFGSCPIFSITIDKDGRSKYKAIYYNDKDGSFSARISSEKIDSLNSILSVLEQLPLSNEYSAGSSDMPTYILSIQKDTIVKKIKDYGPSGPQQLQKVYDFIFCSTEFRGLEIMANSSVNGSLYIRHNTNVWTFVEEKMQIMKYCITVLLMTLITSYTYSQSSFLAEGKSIRISNVVKTYNFYYQTKDSITLFFSDSITTFLDPTKTILKEITYSKGDTEPTVRLEYLRLNKNDSICKLFKGDKLAMVYETRFDSLDRIIYYAMKRFWPIDLEDDGFEWTYVYHDSLVSPGMITTQTVFVDDAYGGKQFHFRVISEYDRKNRKLKEVRENGVGDSMAQITTYIYDKDSLIGEGIKTGDYENVFLYPSQNNSPCNIKIERAISISQFDDFSPLIRQLLLDNLEILNSDKCENFFCTYFSPKTQVKIIIRKVQPYLEGGRNVSVIVIKAQ